MQYGYARKHWQQTVYSTMSPYVLTSHWHISKSSVEKIEHFKYLMSDFCIISLAKLSQYAQCQSNFV